MAADVTDDQRVWIRLVRYPQQSNMAADRNEDSKVKDGSAVSEKVLFVRNLPFSTKDQDLENIFSDVGPIKRSFVIRDKGKIKLLADSHVAWSYTYLPFEYKLSFTRIINQRVLFQMSRTPVEDLVTLHLRSPKMHKGL